MFGFVKKLLGLSVDARLPTQSTALPDEHALIVMTQDVAVTIDAIYAVEDALTAALEKAGVGELDGHDLAVDGSHALLYIYGPDADELLRVARPVLLQHEVTASGSVKLRYGAADNPAAAIKTMSIRGTVPGV